MNLNASRGSLWGRLLLGLATCCAAGLPRVGSAATPNSPEVRRMLDQGVAYLNRSALNGVHATQLGGQALAGLAVYKYQRRFNPQEPGIPALTQSALERTLRTAQDRLNLKALDNYSLGIGLVFLTEVKVGEHPSEIQLMLEELLSRQKPNGSWGYGYSDKGDTSQFQYAALGLWSAKHSGCRVSDDIVVNLLHYVLRVQDPSGAWGYQGNDPGTFTRVIQAPIRPSLSAAGLGTLYVLADLLGMSRGGVPQERPKDVPAVFRPVLAEDKSPQRRSLSSVDAQLLKQAMEDGNEWFRRLPSLQTEQWQYYFLYGYERYHTFRELYEGTAEAEPRWYNEGVRVLQALQTASGHWGAEIGDNAAPTENDPVVGTAFAMLFLLRSTRDTVERVVERGGVLRGGHDLPADLTDVRLRDHKLVAPAIVGEVADLIEMLEKDDADKIESMLDNPDSLSLSGLSGEGRPYTERLARVLRTGSYQARIVAARALGRQGELDNVPILIYALTDGDPRVVREAQAGLRLTSRKFDGMDLPENPTQADLDAMVARWQAWYKTIRPDGALIEPSAVPTPKR